MAAVIKKLVACAVKLLAKFIYAPASGIAILAVIFAAVPFVVQAQAEQQGKSFANTTWTSNTTYADSTSIVHFLSDGSWTEDWKGKHKTGSWQTNDHSTEVTVTRSDGVILHYRLDPNGNLIRDYAINIQGEKASARTTYKRANDLPGPPDTNSFGSPTVSTRPSVAPTVNLTADQAAAVVLITGDNSEGTGFMVKTADGPCIITNIHVIANNPNLKITTTSGAQVKMLSAKGAADRDLAMLAIQDDHYSYLDLVDDLSKTAQPGDEVVTPGNSQGGDVMLNTAGRVLGIGPQRIEFDNPIYHGNSGGPVIHIKSGKVLGVVTEAMKVDTSNAVDKASFSSRNSAISGTMRYFGLRVDNVPNWVPIDWRRFQNETAFLNQFHQRSRCLDSLLNTSPKDPPAKDSDALDPNLWSTDEKIRKAADAYLQQAGGGADSSQRLDAERQLQSDLEDIADINFSTIQDLDNFYSFDQDRAKSEIAYRKALKKELEAYSDNLSQLSGVARKSD